MTKTTRTNQPADAPAPVDSPQRTAGTAISRGPALTVAIVGADSFLGRNLVKTLEHDARVGRVVAIDYRAPSTAAKKTRFYDLDLTQPACEERLAEILSAERVDALVHTAFLSSPTSAAAWAHEFESVGTMHVLHAARHARVPKLIHWSQTLLYGARPENPNHLTEAHALRARTDTPFLADKVAAETEVGRFASTSDCCVTVLRTAPILGPTVRNYLTRYLSHRLVPVLMGFDPLLQFVHEADAIAAFLLAVVRDVPGTFNVVGAGVLPLTTVIRLAGRVPLPVPHPLAAPMTGALWAAGLAEAPAGFVDYLRYLCVADAELAARDLGFRAHHTTRQAVLDFATAQHLRDVRLLRETVSR